MRPHESTLIPPSTGGRDGVGAASPIPESSCPTLQPEPLYRVSVEWSRTSSRGSGA